MKIAILEGMWGNHTRWEPFRRRVSETIAEAVIWKYDNSGKTPPSELAKRLADWVASQTEDFAFVGYSMGGIIVREAARLLGDKQIVAAAFLHSPHQGSVFGQIFDSPATRELAPGSALLAGLPTHTFPVMATWCPFDLVVVPGNSASLPCERNVRIDIPAHNAPVWAEQVHREVLSFLGEYCGGR